MVFVARFKTWELKNIFVIISRALQKYTSSERGQIILPIDSFKCIINIMSYQGWSYRDFTIQIVYT